MILKTTGSVSRGGLQCYYISLESKRSSQDGKKRYVGRELMEVGDIRI